MVLPFDPTGCASRGGEHRQQENDLQILIRQPTIRAVAIPGTKLPDAVRHNTLVSIRSVSPDLGLRLAGLPVPKSLELMGQNPAKS
jgi:hypothetical protein